MILQCSLFGSNSEVRARKWEVRFALKTRHGQPDLSGLKAPTPEVRRSIRSPRRRGPTQRIIGQIDVDLAQKAEATLG